MEQALSLQGIRGKAMHLGVTVQEDSQRAGPLKSRLWGAPICRSTGQLWDTLCLRQGEARVQTQTSQ